MFEPVIGLEIHAHVSTKSKLYCRCSNDSFGVAPNTNVCPICMGFPGMLPVINKEAIKKAKIAALALYCEIPEFCKFDRKNYFYPDLPKGFQISQYDKPLSINGYLEIMTRAGVKKIRIRRLHLEDDAGKLVHTADGTLCDYNRSGAPLMEIVSEPDIFSVEEALEYSMELQRILRYIGASECDMEKGMMRFDVNISLRKEGETSFGTRTEIKNLNSFNALEKALKFEIERQKELLESKKEVTQETRGWDPDKEITYLQRSKEEAGDYRYFPEPDLPPLQTSREEAEELKKSVPEAPLARRLRFIKEYKIREEDAHLFTGDKEIADFFEEIVKTSNDSQKSASFMQRVLSKYIASAAVDKKQKTLSGIAEPRLLGRLIALVNKGVISDNQAKGEIFEEMIKTKKDPEEIVKEKGLELVSDESAITEICRNIIAKNPEITASIKKGKTQAIGVLVGQVMKVMKGKASPKLVNDILQKLI